MSESPPFHLESSFLILRPSKISGVGGSILSLTYGLPLKRIDDPWIALAGEGLQCLTSSTVPGKYAVDVVGFLKYLPEWFPGATFQREAREGRELMRHFFRHPFETTKKGMVRPFFDTT